MANYLDGKVAIVTGSGRGIGAGVAKALANEGAKVIVNDIGAALDGEGLSNTPAEQVVDEIKSSGGEAVPNYTDISTMEGGESVVQTAVDTYGQLDIVVTVAGILRDRMIFNMTEEEWDDVVRVHLKGTFTVCKRAALLYRQAAELSPSLLNQASLETQVKAIMLQLNQESQVLLRWRLKT